MVPIEVVYAVPAYCADFDGRWVRSGWDTYAERVTQDGRIEKYRGPHFAVQRDCDTFVRHVFCYGWINPVGHAGSDDKWRRVDISDLPDQVI